MRAADASLHQTSIFRRLRLFPETLTFFPILQRFLALVGEHFGTESTFGHVLRGCDSGLCILHENIAFLFLCVVIRTEK